MNDKDAFIREFNVSRETIEKFEIYEAQLKKWAPKINLISLSTIDDIWTRHFNNSAQILSKFEKLPKSIIYFGTGAVFPGLVLAIFIANEIEDYKVTLVDENHKRISFLRETARAMGLRIEILHSKVEALVPQKYEILTARAFAPLDKLLDLSHTYAQEGARLLFPKGKDVKNEIEIAQRKWNFNFEIEVFDKNSGSCILEISELERAK